MPTIGVAVAVPEPWATRLQGYRSAVGDATATRVPSHTTVVPPAHVEESELDLVENHPETAAEQGAPCGVHPRGTGSFRPVSPVVFVSLVEGISQCEQLADAVRRGPLATDLEFPYHPHVTIAHDLDDDALDRAFGELADFDCVFDVDGFHLYVHDADQGWRPTREFTLQAPTAG